MFVVRVGPKVHVGNTSNNITMETSPRGDNDTVKNRKKDHRMNRIYCPKEFGMLSTIFLG